MEKTIRIPIDKNLAIYGRLNGSLDKPLYIHVHGLPGDVYDSLAVAATQWFAKQGYTTFRFDLYGWRKDARQLADCTLAIHAADIDAVVRYFRKKGVKRICISGHSFGGPSILLSKDQDFDAVTLWDPSYDLSFTKTKYGFPGGKFVKALNGYFMRWGTNVIIGKSMAKEVDALKWDRLTQNFKAPIKIIAAGKGVLVKGCRKYFTNANEPKEIEVMKGATHYFDDTDDMQERVFMSSKAWFERH